MSGKVWSPAQAREWYDRMPWLRGANYLPADCPNRIAFWQELEFEKHLETMDREMALMQTIGYNSIRVILEFIVWEQQHDGFLKRFERVVSTAAKYGVSLMVCFGNDCTVPRDEKYRAPELGPQPCDWGYHGARKNSPHSGYKNAVGYNPVLDEPETAERFYAMVREMVGLYAADPRIVVWDLFNEPGNGNRGDVSLPHVKRIFEEARKAAPMQPLTSGIWHSLGTETAAEHAALELSDVISYHNYGGYAYNVEELCKLRKLGRPLLNTEWLHRIFGNTVQELFPLFFLEKVGCWNWGLVAGLSQTYEPWDSIWNAYEPGKPCGYDFTKWQHDLFRPSLRPYDPKEIEIIKRFTALAAEQEGR